MKVPPALVATARCLWQWEWQRLMDGLAPADSAGNFQRRPSQFSGAALTPLVEQAINSQGKLCLIVGRSCPWAHRAWLVWSLRDLKELIELVIVEPDPKGGRWVFKEPKFGCYALTELYQLCNADGSSRATVPVLLDSGDANHSAKILNNESAEIIEILNLLPPLKNSLDFSSASNFELVKNLSDLMQHNVNDGVYRCGFARNQSAYDQAEHKLFSTLKKLDEALTNQGPWLGGTNLSFADVRLFPTLIRWEQVYAPLFACSRFPLFMFPAIWAWRAKFFDLPGVAPTCSPAAWRQDYFGSLFPLHPSHIIPAGPESIKELRILVNATIKP
jgi:putative glutathione S-transferase